MTVVMTSGGPLDLSTILLKNHITFVGRPINSQVVQRVISELVTIVIIDGKAYILV